MKRGLKRLFIIFIYLMIFSAIGLFFYMVLKPNPTCFDGEQNQAEDGIDCGGPCQPCEKEIVVQEMEILEKYFVQGTGEFYDVMAKLDNPNNRYGAAKFYYEFNLVDKEGNSLANRRGESFILPGETKYVIELNLQSQVHPYTAKFEIIDVAWEEFLNYEEPRLSIYNKNYAEESGKSEVFGLMKNESYFDFNSIEIDIILRDESGNPLALGKNEMRTISSQQERDFRVFWPYNFSREVRDIEIRAEADVFDPNNSYVKKYMPQRFRDYR
ncbi:MAG: hypothetical protein PHH24_00665 [Candidatus Moranbacteria bacterium]|jgi:hypothetical protein|nr:hypothetical protein [Candidatus Moranbacteria bacterium]MDD5652062.1 hypothetical protein [Candidatus Moranbacteria bacterium]MDX9855773.1 hypothetical protein [Candidatus Moranbacteria bacterium]